MINLNKAIYRSLSLVHRKADLQAKFSPEGIYLKGRGQHWTSAVFLPWASVYDYAALATAKRLKEEARERRRQARLSA